MAKRGGQLGNHSSAEGKRWRMAINAALENKGTEKHKALVAVAEKLIEKAIEGDLGAIKELGDRIDGKSVQPVDMKGELNSNVKYTVTGLKRG